jgi:competence protein ComEC
MVAGILLLLGLTGCVTSTVSTEAPSLALYAPYVGQGHGLLLHQNNLALVIDAGPTAQNALVARLDSLAIAQLQDVVITHWDLDHCAGLDILFAHAKIRRILQSYTPEEPWLKARWQAWCSQAEQGCQTVTEGQELSVLNNHRLRVLSSRATAPTDNERSLAVAIFTDADTTRAQLLVTGDLDTTGEARLLSQWGQKLSAEVLQLGHHGSRTSGSLAFIGAVSPRIALVQSGIQNDYDHPHEEPLAHALATGAITLSVARDGPVHIVFTPQATLP